VIGFSWQGKKAVGKEGSPKNERRKTTPEEKQKISRREVNRALEKGWFLKKKNYPWGERGHPSDAWDLSKRKHQVFCEKGKE